MTNFIPSKGHALEGICDRVNHGQREHWSVFIFPSTYPPVDKKRFYYISSLQSEKLRGGAILDATAKPIQQDLIATTLQEVMKVPVNEIKWEERRCKPMGYNFYLYSNKKQYIQQYILNKTKKDIS